jgi:hypothetical protein
LPFIGQDDVAGLAGLAVPHRQDASIRIEIGRAQGRELGISASCEQPAAHKVAKSRLAGIHKADPFRFGQIAPVLKATLNHAWKAGDVASDDAWRRVKPLKGPAFSWAQSWIRF